MQCHVVARANTTVLELAWVAVSVDMSSVKRGYSWSPNGDLLVAHGTQEGVFFVQTYSVP